MRSTIVVILCALACATSVAAQQSKGVDRQSERIRDAGSERVQGKNGEKTDVGTGRGIDFGRGRTSAPAALPNPLRVTSPRDALMQNLEELMRERKLIIDTTASKPDEGILVSQPYTFSRGAIVTTSELNRNAALPAGTTRNWSRARYTLIVEMQSIDSASANVSVNARIEAKADNLGSAEWVSLPSSGAVEQEFLVALQNRLNGVPVGEIAPRP